MVRLADRVARVAKSEGRMYMYGDVFPTSIPANSMDRLMREYGMELLHETPILHIYRKII